MSDIYKFNVNLIDNITKIYGNDGVRWLDELPHLIQYYQTKWQLKNLAAHSDLSYNPILFGRLDNSEMALKLSYSKDDLQKELELLEIYQNHGAVRVIEYDEQVVLMQKGHKDLKSAKLLLEQEIEIYATLFQQMLNAKQPSQTKYKSEQDLFRSLSQTDNKLSRYRDKADKYMKDIDRQREYQLLHGDLHHGNIIKTDEGWCFIDPKGINCTICFELANFIRNPIDQIYKNKNAKEIVLKRVNMLSQIFKLDNKLLLQYVYIQSLLAWQWALQDDLGDYHFQQSVEMMEQIMQETEYAYTK